MVASNYQQVQNEVCPVSSKAISVNFEYLKKYDSVLYKLAYLSEKLYLTIANDPCLCQLRRFSEYLAGIILRATNTNIQPEEKSQAEVLFVLKQRNIIYGRIHRNFQWLREVGNKACHCDNSLHIIERRTDVCLDSEALLGLKKAHELAVWYIRSFHSKDFKEPIFRQLNHSRNSSTEIMDELNKKMENLEIQLQQQRTDLASLKASQLSSNSQSSKVQMLISAIKDATEMTNNSLSIKEISENLRSICPELREIEIIFSGNCQEKNVNSTSTNLGMEVDAQLINEYRQNLQKGIFNLVVVGEFKHGKTTLINSLLGDKKLPAKSTPATAIITMLVYGSNNRILIHYNDSDQTEALDWETFTKQYQLTIQDSESISQNLPIDRFKDIKYAEIEVPYDLCRNGVRLIDSPGLEEHVTRTKISTNFLKQAHAVIFVLNAIQILSASEKEFIISYFLPKSLEINNNSLTKNVFFVVNKINLVDEDEREEIIEYTKNFLRPIFTDENQYTDVNLLDRRVFFVDAREALKIRSTNLSNSLDALEMTGVAQLERELQDFLSSTQRYDSVLSALIDRLVVLIGKADQKIERRISSLHEPLEDILNREKLCKEKLAILQQQLKRINSIIDRYKESFSDKLIANFQIFIDGLNNKWVSQYEKYLKKGTETDVDLNFSSLFNVVPMMFDKVKQEKTSKNIQQGVSTFIQNSLYEWTISVNFLMKDGMEKLSNELQECLNDLLREMQNIELFFSQNTAEYSTINQSNEEAELVIAKSISIFENGGYTDIFNSFDFGEFLWSTVKQAFLVSGILSIFGGPIEWILLITAEIMVLTLDQQEKERKTAVKIGDVMQVKLKENLPIMEVCIRNSINEKFESLSHSLIKNMTQRLKEVYDELDFIVDQRKNLSVSTEENIMALNVIREDLVRHFNKIYSLKYDKSLTIEDIRWISAAGV